MENLNCAVYTREHDYEAWTFKRFASHTFGILIADVNLGFGVQTLLTPRLHNQPGLLDSCQTQRDIEF